MYFKKRYDIDIFPINLHDKCRTRVLNYSFFFFIAAFKYCHIHLQRSYIYI